jgi:hypothetical protein
MGYSISLAVSVKRLTRDSIQIVRVIILCGEFVGVCTTVGFIECSNKLVHCIGLQFAIVQAFPDCPGFDSSNQVQKSCMIIVKNGSHL